MKNRLIIAMAAVTAIIFSSCNNEDNNVPEWNGEIKLSSGISLQTRSGYGIDQQIAANEPVSVYMDEITTGSVLKQLYGRNDLTANGNGGFTGGTAMFYPANGDKIDIYAIHAGGGALSGKLGDAFPTSPIVATVNNKQTDKAAYAASDLLYATKEKVAKSSNAVELTFYHLLSKVEVALKSGNGTPDLTGATVTIEGTALKTNFTPSKTVDMADAAARAGMLSKISTSNSVEPIAIPTVVIADFTNNTNYGEAIVVPQTITKDASFIKVTLKAGGELFYKIPADLTLTSGKKYTYNITVNLTTLTVSSKITDWDPVNPVAGNAVMD